MTPRPRNEQADEVGHCYTVDIAVASQGGNAGKRGA